MPRRSSSSEFSRLFVLTLLIISAFAASLYLYIYNRAQATRLSSVGVDMLQSPACPCCHRYAEYLKSLGASVSVRYADVDAIFDELKIPADLRSCHVAYVGGYAVIGHVPGEAIEKLLKERPSVSGISLPGMPPGSPGMEGAREGPFEIVAFAEDGSRTVFMVV